MPISVSQTRQQDGLLIVDMKIELPGIFKSPGVTMSANVDIPVVVNPQPGHENDAQWLAGHAKDALILFTLALGRELGLDMSDTLP